MGNVNVIYFTLEITEKNTKDHVITIEMGVSALRELTEWDEPSTQYAMKMVDAAENHIGSEYIVLYTVVLAILYAMQSAMDRTRRIETHE